MQDNQNTDPGAISRRSVLHLMGAVGVAASVPLSSAEQPQQDTAIGSFEDGIGDWRTNGSNDLELVDEEQRPYAVQSGTHALQIASNGDPYPMIENKAAVRNADFANNPFLVSDVTVGNLGGEPGKVTFVLRYHYKSAGPPNRDSGQKQERGKKEKRRIVAETPNLGPSLLT